uniref:BRO1 domain-containing protein n=1 Tax=Kalanchoe fedtschenkoi TaxID=63787 RepID=A0A7N0TCK3_KALFE
MAATTSTRTPNTMLAVPEKKTTSLDLYRPLRQYISSAYPEMDARSAEDDLKTVNQIRAEIERNQTGSLTSRRDLLVDYFKALCVMETRFPISPDETHISSVWFTWWDAFRPRSKASQQNIHLEKAAVLFNLGATFCQIGLGCDRSVVEGRKEASHSFIAAAGVFSFLRDNEAVKASNGDSAMVDLSVECTGMLETLMLSQAQECVFENAVAKGSSLGVCAKISRQVGIYYEEALAALNAAPLSQHIDRAWVFHVQMKAAFFFADACYRYSLELHEKEAVGEEIVRLRSGIDALSEAKKSSKGVAVQLLDSVEMLERDMNRNLARALKENDRVYLMRVPSINCLSPLPAVSLVKSMLMNDLLNASTDKLFCSLVPETSAKALSKYTEMVDEIIRRLDEKLQQASELKRVRLKEMDLPDSLLALEGSFALPQDLKNDVESIQSSGGVAGLEAEILQLRDLRKVNQELLVQTVELLQKEAKEDDQLRSQYGTQWVRPQSDNLTKNLQQRLNKFADNLKQAAESDGRIERSLMEHAPLLSILDYNPIESALPALARPVLSLYVSENDVVETLKQSLRQLESISAHRASVEVMLRDMKNKVLPTEHNSFHFIFFFLV